jgi:ribosomal protein L14
VFGTCCGLLVVRQRSGAEYASASPPLLPTLPLSPASHSRDTPALAGPPTMIGLKSTLNVRRASLAARPHADAHAQVIDNSGALLVECVNILKNKVTNGVGGVGDEIVCVVKRARPVPVALGQTAASVKVRRGDVRRAVIVRTTKPVRRPDGRLVRFDDNAAVLLTNKREMLGTRVGGIVSADLRFKGWGKIVALAPKVRPALAIVDVSAERLAGDMTAS